MNREPALVLGLVAAVIGVLLVYGIVDEKQATAWSAFAAAVIPIAQAVVTRHLVVPVSKVRDAGLEPSQLTAVADDPNKKLFVATTT